MMYVANSQFSVKFNIRAIVECALAIQINLLKICHVVR